MPDLATLADLELKLQTLGVKTPPGLARVLAVRAALTAEVYADDPVVALCAAVENGEITKANAAKRVNDAAQRRSVREHAVQIARETELSFSRLASRELVAAADTLIAALQPTFDAAIDGIRTAARYFTADATEAAILAAGPDAAAAWQQLGSHRGTADLIFHVRMTLARSRYGPAEPPAALFLASAADLDVAANTFGDDRGPGGRWHRLIDAGVDLHLTTADDAQTLLAAHKQLKARQLEESRRAMYDTDAHRNGLAADQAWVDNAVRLAAR